MIFLRSFILTIFVLLHLAQPSFAQQFRPAQLVELKTTIKNFETALSANDVKKIVDFIPPKAIENILKEFKLDKEKLILGMEIAIQKTLEDVTILGYKMDVDKATHQKLSDGMGYVLIPTETKMDVKNYGKVIAHSSTLAFIENNQWYLMRTSDPAQRAILAKAYPAFAGVELPGDKLEDLVE